MMKPFGLITLAWVLCTAAFITSVHGQQFKKCETTAFPPNKETGLPVYEVDLDRPPSQRWSTVMKDKGPQVKALVDEVAKLFETIAGEHFYNLLLSNLPKIGSSLPTPYYQELQGISADTGIPFAKITLYNIFYEAFSLCTSLVVQDSTGHVMHARNLDNGAFLGWDSKNHTWRIAELLKPLSVILEWKKDNNTVFTSVNFAGYVGVLTGVKKDKFSFSLDKRFGFNGGIMGILEWVLFGDHKQSWVSLLPREVLETAQSYQEAQITLSSRRLLAPVYYILAGSQEGQGCLITRDRDNTNLLSLGSEKTGIGSWFLVQTNYDHWRSPPFFDDRRTPAAHCLEVAGQKAVSQGLLYNVLSTKPVLNKETVYTALMDAKAGTISGWLRSCPDPCWPW